MSDNFDDIILNELKPLRIQYSIKRFPTYKLRECLSYYTKQKLIEIAYEHGVHISMSNNKDIIIEIVEEILIERIANDSLYMTIFDRELIARLIKNRGIAGDDLEKTIKLKYLGYIYWFYDNGEFYAVCPVEIANRYMIAYEEDNEEIVKRNNEILSYINALQHIYGVFEIDQLLVVWNKYNKYELDMLEANEFLNMVGRRQNYFWWDPPYIVSDYFMDDGEYEKYLRDRSKVDYYIPIKEELNYYMKNEFDEDNIYYKKIMKLLENNKDLDLRAIENISVSIEIACTLDGSLQQIMDEMTDEGFSFDDFDELNEFAQLYMKLSNSTRKWAIKGHKPDELAKIEQKSLNKTRKDNIIPFPQASSTKAKKIGRNEPCPCGSGKKYKFCCGK